MAFREHVRTELLAVGDQVGIYATRGCWHNPTRDQAQVAAVGTVASPVRTRSVAVHDEVMPRSCRLRLDTVLEERRGVPFQLLVNRLALTKGRQSWGPVMRRTIVSLTDDDMMIIQSEVRHASRVDHASANLRSTRSMVS